MRPATANKDFKLDGVLYKKGHPVDYSKWPRHTLFQLRSFLTFGRPERSARTAPPPPVDSTPPPDGDDFPPPPAAA